MKIKHLIIAAAVVALSSCHTLRDGDHRLVLLTTNDVHGAIEGYAVASHMKQRLEKAGAQVLLAASVFHFHIVDIGELKKYLAANGFEVSFASR